MTRGCTLAAVVGLGLCAGSAGAVTIGFDDLTNLTVVTNQYQSLGVVFTGHLLVLGPGPTTNPVSAPNSVAYFDPVSQLNNYVLRADFVVPGTSNPAVTDFVAFTPTDASSGNTLFELRAFDVNGVLLDSASSSVTSTGVYDPMEDPEQSVSAAGIAYVELAVSLAGSTNRVIEGDDFRFNDPVGVPEPTATGLLGLAAAAVLARRRRPS